MAALVLDGSAFVGRFWLLCSVPLLCLKCVLDNRARSRSLYYRSRDVSERRQ
jgi:hypothetical protein